jgi:molecular chaperone DnaK
MANQNRTLGRFDLVGIPPAPRGVPQIEVTFDIDANGIVHVSAKDLGTGKEQKIRIESSSGLSEDDIDKMVKEAEAHAEEDKREKEKIEVKNEADSLIYATEKSLTDYGDKVDESEKKKIEDAIADLRGVLDSGDVATIKEKIETLKQASYKLAEEVYKTSQTQAGAEQEGSAAGAGAAGAEGAGPGEAGQSGSENSEKSNVEDVDYEVVDEDEDESSS